MAFTDVYLQPDAPDPVLEESVVVEAARLHAPHAGRLLSVDESGGEARAYFLEGDVVLKTQRPHRLRPRTSLAKEALVLEELASAGDIPTPRALGHGEVEGIEYLCITRISGSALRHVTLDQSQRAAALRELGRTLRTIHELGSPALKASDLIPGDRVPEDLSVRISQQLERLVEVLDEAGFGERIDLGGVASECLGRMPPGADPVALHSNPGPEHTFVDPVTGRYSGLIDFGDSYRSHPAFDFRPWSAPQDAKDVLAGYRSVGPLPERFEDALGVVLIVGELGRAARGMRSPEELKASLDRLLGDA